MARRVVATERYPVLPGGIFKYGGYYNEDGEVHVNMDEFKRAIEAARHRYEAMLPKCVTTFYLEPMAHVPTRDEIERDSPEYKKTMLALRSIPFPCLRIVQTVFTLEGQNMETEVICFGDGPRFGWCARDRNTVTGRTAYSPTGLVPDIDDSLPMSYLRLMEVLSNNSARYEERPVSRQVRRRTGYADSYREYIVIRKPTKDERKTALRLTAIMRRHPRLHAVRGHLRHYRTGLVVPVAPHVRGKGEMLQVKDYITEEAYYSEA